ncbi:AMP-binding protein [Actinomadura viridis]|uniref:Acyl-coenzyme A synthetase/AMP-(Fatty) acid ligase n=1 Tax=Actinomadura viridis TaxID=58110 RepID=A0A931DG52_9ACTN|nr:class I adenylate-forming enzyme family protein [Actinomadura viridis]MBG6086876.1 acyl-coenzyme A synthetase/AMP-(fatty) acid ligase [Actinomadura viridis]
MGNPGKRQGAKGKVPRNIGVMFEGVADAERPVFHLDRPFDIAPKDGTRHTVGDLARLVAETSGALYEAGLRKGDRLGIVKDNHFDVVLLAAAAARIGALPAMISATNSPEVLRAIFERLEPRVLVASSSVLAAAVRDGVELAGSGTAVVAVDRGDGDGPAGVLQLEDLRGAPVPAADPVGDDEPMICTHTSGTTGVPKLVAHSANTLLGVLTKLETLPLPGLSIRPGDVVGSCIAFVHGRSITWTFAQLARPPAKVVVLADPDPATVVATLSEHRPTTLEACPNIFQLWEGLLRSNPGLFTQTRAFINTFDAIHPRTVRAFLEASGRRSPVWGQVWGQTEVGPVCMGVYTRRKLRRSRWSQDPVTSNVGRPIPFVTQVRVVDPQTRRKVRRGQEGIVLVRTKGRCLDYLGETDRHREKDWGQGWWNTGDIGVHGRTGGFRIVDREVDLIPGVSGIALESVLLERLEETSEVIVLGVPGRRPVPVLSVDGGELDPERWRKATADLPDLEDPVLIGWDEFPRTGTWKVRRPVLRERLFGTKETYGTGRWT